LLTRNDARRSAVHCHVARSIAARDVRPRTALQIRGLIVLAASAIAAICNKNLFGNAAFVCALAVHLGRSPPSNKGRSSNARSIRIASSNSRRMWSRRRLVLRIRLAKAAKPPRCIHALTKGHESAVRTASSATVNRAPRIILGLGAISNADENSAKYQQEQY
jgi:hypothetical protein